MRVSRIEARRAFTRYGWKPIKRDNFLKCRGVKITTLESADYKVVIHASAADESLNWYAQVTDRKCNERYYLSAIRRSLRYEEMKKDLKLN